MPKYEAAEIGGDNGWAVHALRPARPVLRNGRPDWYRIENKADLTSVWIFDEIGYYGVTASDFAKDLAAITADEITLHINSPGGECHDGIAIYNAIRNHPARVTVHIEGLAASAASFIAMAGDEIIIEKTAQMMVHDARSLILGNPSDLRQLADLLDKMSVNIAGIYADRTGASVDHWREQMRIETWYSGAEAVEAKLADRLATKKEAPTDVKVAASWDLSFFTYAGRDNAPPPTPPPAQEAPEALVNDGGFVFDPQAFRNAVHAAYPQKEAVS